MTARQPYTWLVLLTTLLAPISAPAQDVTWRKNYASARQEAEQKNRPLVLVIGTTNCPWCARLETVTFRDAAVVKALAEGYVNLKVDGDDYPALITALNIECYPTVVVASPKGRIIEVQKGYVEPAAFAELLSRALTKLPPTETPAAPAATITARAPATPPAGGEATPAGTEPTPVILQVGFGGFLVGDEGAQAQEASAPEPLPAPRFSEPVPELVIPHVLSLEVEASKPRDVEDEHAEHECHEEEHEPSDLTLRNFWEGWDEKFEERERPDRAVRLPLFGVRKGFLTREFVLGYEGEFNAEGGDEDRHSLIGGVSLPLNRRFELGFEPRYTWVNRRNEHTVSGAQYLSTATLQLIDTHDTAVNVAVSTLTPNSRIATHDTELEFVAAGWQDLGQRWALSGHFGDIVSIGPRTRAPEALALEGGLGEDLLAPEEEKEARNRLTYGVALAKTLTDPDQRFLADFTVVAEAFGTTDLDGSHSGRTDLLIGPGVFWNIGREESPLWVSGFIACPVTGPRSSDATVQFTLRKEF